MVLTEIQSHQLFYYTSKSEVSDILGFFTVIVITKKNKKYAVPLGNTWASLLSTCDFHRKMNKIQKNKISRKGKQRGVDIKQEDVLQVVVRKTLIG